MKKLAALLVLLAIPLICQSKTLAVFREDFRKKTFELTGNQTTELHDSIITVWINEGQDAVSSLLAPLELRIAFLSNGEFLEVAMPTDFEFVRAAQVKDRGALAKVPPERFGFVDTLLGAYYTHGQTFHFDGHLRTNPSDSIIVLYYGSPTDMVASGDTSDVPRNLQRLIVDWAYGSYEMSRHRVQVGLAIRADVAKQLEAARIARQVAGKTE